MIAVRAHPLVRRLLSPTGFLLVLGCFALPFVSASCTPAPNATMSATYRGVDLVVGNRPEVGISDEFPREVDHAALPASPQTYRDKYTQPIPAQRLMALAFAVTAFGVLGAGLPWPWRRALAATGSALTAAILLAGAEVIALHAARTRLIADAGPIPGTAPDRPLPATAAIETRYGFWLALLLLGLVAIGNGIGLLRLSRRPSTDVEVP